MEQNDPKNRYRFPKSRSKNFKKALGLAEALQGFKEADGFYWVEPSAEERDGKKFQKLLSYSKSWKDAGFFVGDTEVSEAEWPRLSEGLSEVKEAPVGDGAPKEAAKENEDLSPQEQGGEVESPETTPTEAAKVSPQPESQAKDAAVSQPKETKSEASPKETKAEAKSEGTPASEKKGKAPGGPSKIEIHAPPEEPTPPMAVAAMWILIVVVLFLLWKITFGSS